jgi:ABC-type nitrate/sulfonate/bicarbonate transport system substrate-binding protein
MAYSEIKVVAFPGAPNLPIFAALDNGYFKDEGVQIDFSTTPSSVYQFEALAAGTADIAMTAFDNVVAYRNGSGAVKITGKSDFSALMGATQIELAFVANSTCKSISELLGHSIALDALTTGFAFVLYEMLSRSGVNLADCKLIPVGATPERWKSVQEGNVVGTLTIEPFTSLANAAGFPTLELSTNLFNSYQGGVVAAKDTWANDNPQVVKAYLRSYLRGLDWVLDPTNTVQAQELLLTKMPAIKPKVVESVMRSLLNPRTGLTADGALLTHGVSTVLELRRKYGSGELLPAEDYLNLASYKEVLQERLQSNG